MSALIVFCAQYLFLLPLFLLVYVWLKADNPTKKLLLGRTVVAAIVAIGLVLAARQLFPTVRPYLALGIQPLISHPPTNNSFPSGHTTASFTAAFLILPLSPYLGGLAILASLLVGVGRVAAHVHYPIDIFGGFIVAAIASAVGSYTFRKRN